MGKPKELDLTQEPLIGRIIDNPKAAILLTAIILISQFDSCMQQATQEFQPEDPLLRQPGLPGVLFDIQNGSGAGGEFTPIDFLGYVLETFDSHPKSIPNVIFDQRREIIQ